MQITGIFTFFPPGLYIYSGQAAKCSRIAPLVQGLDATSVQEHAEVVHKYNEGGHKL